MCPGTGSQTLIDREYTVNEPKEQSMTNDNDSSSSLAEMKHKTRGVKSMISLSAPGLIVPSPGVWRARDGQAASLQTTAYHENSRLTIATLVMGGKSRQTAQECTELLSGVHLLWSTVVSWPVRACDLIRGAGRSRLGVLSPGMRERMKKDQKIGILKSVVPMWYGRGDIKIGV